MLRVWLSMVFSAEVELSGDLGVAFAGDARARRPRARAPRAMSMPSASRGAVGPRRQVRTPRRRSSRVASSRSRCAPKRSKSLGGLLQRGAPRAAVAGSARARRPRSSGRGRLRAVPRRWPRRAPPSAAASSWSFLREQRPRRGCARRARARGGCRVASAAASRRAAARSAAATSSLAVRRRSRAAQTSGRSAGTTSGSSGPPPASRMVAMPVSGRVSAWMMPSVQPARARQRRLAAPSRTASRASRSAPARSPLKWRASAS